MEKNLIIFISKINKELSSDYKNLITHIKKDDDFEEIIQLEDNKNDFKNMFSKKRGRFI